MELVIGLALFVFAWRLRRAARRLPQPPIRIEVYHYTAPGPGERGRSLLRPEVVEDQPFDKLRTAGSNVVPFRRGNLPGAGPDFDHRANLAQWSPSQKLTVRQQLDSS